MKLNFQQDDDIPARVRKTRKSRRGALGRRGIQLGQALGEVLSTSLNALQSWRQPASSVASAASTSLHSHRLREVIERDRAIAAAQPTPAQADPASAQLPSLAQLPAEAASSTDANEPVDAEFEELESEHATGPRADSIAQAIADANAESGEAEPALSEPIQLEPLVAASSVTVVMPKKAAKKAEGGKEPIRTRTMAKLLASQGHRERALSIYEDLLRKDASDQTLLAEAEALRNATD